MKINESKEKYIFVELNKNDMAKLELDYTDMNYADEKTRKTIYSVLDRVKTSLGQNFELSDTVRVEVLPRDDGGCMLFFTIGERPKKYKYCGKTSEMYFLFDSIDSIFDFANAVGIKKREKLESSLYLSNDDYYLKLKGELHRCDIMISNEYSVRIGKKEFYALKDNRCVIEKNALNVLCGSVSE